LAQQHRVAHPRHASQNLRRSPQGIISKIVQRSGIAGAGQSIFDVVNEGQLAVERLIAVEPVLLGASIQVIVTIRDFFTCSVGPLGEVANEVEFEVTGVPEYSALWMAPNVIRNLTIKWPGIDEPKLVRVST